MSVPLMTPVPRGQELFVASREWREVAAGQAIPGGLHVRSDLATGKTEARLMEPGREGVVCILPNK